MKDCKAKENKWTTEIIKALFSDLEKKEKFKHCIEK